MLLEQTFQVYEDITLSVIYVELRSPHHSHKRGLATVFHWLKTKGITKKSYVEVICTFIQVIIHSS